MTETGKQKRIPQAERECCVCVSKEKLVAVTPIIYLRGEKLRAGRRLLFCESCIVLATVGGPGQKQKPVLANMLLASVREVYKAVRRGA